MKILYHFQTRGTGPEAVHIAGIATAFEELGHSVSFSNPRNVDPRQTAGSSPFAGRSRGLSSPVVFELLQIAYNFLALAKNLLVVRRLRPTLIYERHAFFLCSTAWLCRLLRIPLVVEVNELVGDPRVREQPTFSPLARLADRMTFGAARLIVVVSPHLQRRIVALGVPAHRLVVLPNAVRRTEVEVPADGAPVRARLGASGNLLVGFVGWFVEWHRFDLLLEAFASVSRQSPSARLVLVGEGPLESSIREQASRAGIEGQVLFAGAVSHREIPGHIAAMDVCVVPHSNEYRSPIKLFEYMAQGRAVVAPSTEPIASVIHDGRHGLLFEPGSSEGLARALGKLVGNPALRTQLGQSARELVLEKHTWTRNAEAVLAGAGLTSS